MLVEAVWLARYYAHFFYTSSLSLFSQLPEPFTEMLAVEPANLLEFMLR